VGALFTVFNAVAGFVIDVAEAFSSAEPIVAGLKALALIFQTVSRLDCGAVHSNPM
jgi:hypothetical protein